MRLLSWSVWCGGKYSLESFYKIMDLIYEGRIKVFKSQFIRNQIDDPAEPHFHFIECITTLFSALKKCVWTSQPYTPQVIAKAALAPLRSSRVMRA